MIRGERSDIDGTTVVIHADTEAGARAAAAAAESARLDAEGSPEEKAKYWIDRRLDGVGAMNSAAMRNTAHILAWVFLLIGGAFAWQAGSNLWALDELKPAFGAFAVGVVASAKFAAGRWAKALNDGNASAAAMFRNVAIICVLASAALGFSLQGANMVNRQTGATTIKVQIEDYEGSLRRMRAEADEIDRPREAAAQIERELQALLARSAINFDGRPAPFNVAGAVEHGTETFCRGSSFYKNKYCPDILDLQGALEARQIYEQKITDIRMTEQMISDLRAQTTHLSGAEAIGQTLGVSGLWGAALGALLILLIDMFMVGAAYVAHRYPRGVE
jgi:hypothetical protein